MRFVAKMHPASRRMVELWRGGEIHAVVNYAFFVDQTGDPENQMIRMLAEGKHVHMEMRFVEQITPALDGPKHITNVPQGGPTKSAESDAY